MVTGILLTKCAGKDYVGFIDADNYVAGAVNEYVKNFAAGFHMAKSPYVMVRTSWKYKPKFSEEGVYFRKWDKISELTNKYVNLVLSKCTGFETEILKTGNAGEHAMTMKLAEILQYSSRFSLEAYELIHILEEFGGLKASNHKEVMEKGAEIFQIETRNPHFHEAKGEEHLQEMLQASLSSIYHSPICNENIKTMIRDELIAQKALKPNKEIANPRKMPSLQRINHKTFGKTLQAKAKTMTIIE